ncbi:MAG: protein-(glutamine-N5) methyltransferase, release factor-specific [Rickettsiales bacterium]|nr:protein-(glutamine-N5) methyltransferase, release factor-specific [Rickettsiales bacterium]
MPTLAMAQHAMSTQLSDAQIDNARLDARLLIQHALDMTAEQLVRDAQQTIDEAQYAAIEALVQRRAAHEPLAQIVGTKPFWRDAFVVSRDVLSPRPDSETLIEAVLAHRPDTYVPYAVLDLGVGSGCLLLSVLREYTHASGTGVDVSDAALAIAQQNAKNLQLDGRVSLKKGNWGKTLQKPYDIVISNPPYIALDARDGLAPEVKDYEPALALFGGSDGLECYRELAMQLPSLLAQDGIAVIELGAGQAADVSELFQRAGMQVKECKNDLNAIPRALVLTHE